MAFYENTIDPRRKIKIKSYESEEISSKGLVVLPNQVGHIEKDVVFEVLDLSLTYKIFPGRP